MITQIQSASVEFIEQPFLKPLQISSGLITQATEARVAVTVRVGDLEGTGRGSIYLSDLWASPQDWQAVAQRKPVLLDEGLTSLDLLPTACKQHWSGLALKTCKGHSFSLVAAAWARENNLLLSLQDLTNPGYSAIHSFLFGAHLATFSGVELNSPQYTPAANQPWLPELSSLFEPRQGLHRLDLTTTPGLGSSLFTRF